METVLTWNRSGAGGWSLATWTSTASRRRNASRSRAAIRSARLSTRHTQGTPPTALTAPAAASRRCRTVPENSQSLLREYARTRDVQIRNQLVLQHDRMVRYLAGRFVVTPGTASEDLVQVGYVGLIAALDRFDP